MSPAFILASTPFATPLPSSPSLNLLPFSLGPNSKPYASSSAPLHTFFRPRPAPAGTPGIPTGTPIAAFRGRQLAAQDIPVPRGYKGLILSADRPDVVRYASSGASTPADPPLAGEAAQGRGRGRTRREKWPLTPATSAASTIGGSEAGGPQEEEGDPHPELGGIEMRRSTRTSGFERLKQRVKGAGQVAVARPRKPQVQVGKKRYRLDSDDEDETEDEGETKPCSSTTDETPVPASEPTVVGTPSKRSRPSILSTPTRQSPRLSQIQPRTPAAVPPSARKSHLPAIVLQEATPLKEPLPPPPPHLRKKKNRADYVIPGSPGANEASAGFQDAEERIAEEANVIPSPATENDPPTFAVASPEPSNDAPAAIPIKSDAELAKAAEKDISEALDISGPIRVLRPIATFDAITLWTPDGPLAGYKSSPTAAEEGVKEEQGAGEASKSISGSGSGSDVKVEEEGPRVRPGWWAPGGSGEGGDEVVRAMGEWLGLVEMLNEPVYLDGLHDDDDDDDEGEEEI